MLAVLGAGVLVGVIGCVSRMPDYAGTAQRIEAAFPAFVGLGVDELYVSDSRDGPMTGCAYIRYDRGHFASGRRCKGLFWNQPIPGELDDQAWVDVKRLGAALADPDDGFWYAALDYRTDGAIRSGNFVVDSCGNFQFEPGYGEVPYLDSEDAIAVNDDWYVITFGLGDFLQGC